MNNSQKAALIDLGTNSARLLVVESDPNGVLTILRQEKYPVSLGEGSFKNRKLTDEAISRTIEALKNYKKVADAFEVQKIKAVATSAAREAENRDDFLKRVYEETGLHLKVISGMEEARLIYMGISTNTHMSEEPSLLIDIGGGSAELVIGTKDKHLEMDSLALGAARVAGLFNLDSGDGRVELETYLKMVDYTVRHSRRFAETARGYPLKNCLGSSGTIENLVRIHLKRDYSEGIDSETTTLPTASLRGLGLWLGAMSLKVRKKVNGLDQPKAAIIVAGCAVLEGLLEGCAVNGLQYVDYGLKHGLLHDYSIEINGPSPKASLREDSARKFGRRLRFDEAHADATADWAGKIYDAFAQAALLESGSDEKEIIILAALLHDVGKFLAYESHHIHSWYLIKNSSLLGFDEDEVDLISYLALSHKKKKKKDSWPYILYENDPSLTHLKKLGLIIRMAEIMDLSRQGVISDLSLTVNGDTLHCFIKTTSGHGFYQEVEALAKLSKDIQLLFGLKLQVTSI